MGVVAAGVHAAGRLGLIGHVHLFHQGQSVEIGADGDGFAGLAAVDEAHHVVALDDLIGDAHLLQLLGDAGAGALLLEAQLWVHVELAAHVEDILFHLFGHFSCCHILHSLTNRDLPL